MEIKAKYLEQARRLHRECPAVDAHLDLAGELLFRIRAGERHPLRRRYLTPFREGGFRLIVSSVYLSDAELQASGFQAALDQIHALREEIEANREFSLIRSVPELEGALRHGQIGILLCMEGLDCIGTDRKLLHSLYEQGVRGASLTWSRRNALATGCCRAGEQEDIHGGLTKDGFAAVAELERLGMFLDVSHLNDDGFADVCRAAKRPFVATHSDSRAVYRSYRNLTDEQLREIASRGGIIGLNACGCIAGCAPGEGALPQLSRHVRHMAEVVGFDRIGYGFDLCDAYTEAASPPGTRTVKDDLLAGHGHVPVLTAALLQDGMEEEDAKKLIGGNWLRYFRSVLPSADPDER